MKSERAVSSGMIKGRNYGKKLVAFVEGKTEGYYYAMKSYKVKGNVHEK